VAVRPLVISLETARQLAIAGQQLAGPDRPPPRPDADAVLALVHRLGCLQLDPIQAVARSPLLVLWSRLGSYRPELLDSLLWERRALFEYWAHAASIVCTEDYPLHHLRMRTYPARETLEGRRVRQWLADNAGLRRRTLLALRRRGPLPARELGGPAAVAWSSPGWTDGRSVDRLLFFLWRQGRVLVAGRQGGHRLWDLAERWLPPTTPRARLSAPAAVRSAAERSLRALGVARPGHIRDHFTSGHYPGLPAVLGQLEARGRIVPVEVRGPTGALPGPWYVHADDLPSLERLAVQPAPPRTTLLSPFDNLIRDRARTRLLFDFDFRMEIYVPAAERRHGYYVMPILHGDRLVGRLDPVLDRRQQRLQLRAVHLEGGPAAAAALAGPAVGAIRELARFLGARTIAVGPAVPAAWRRGLA